MKRLSRDSDSLGGLMTICPTTDEDMYSGDQFHSILDGVDEEGGSVEEAGHVGEKKRRLSVTQVKALEKNFELENKLDPERKLKLSQELGLQPRQVAVWFQNRRARWKTKQLEGDYGVLKASYEALKQNFETLQHDNDALRKEIKELKSNLDTESDISVKEEVILPYSENKVLEHSNPTSENPILKSESKDFNHGCFNGASDSDSSAILNEDNRNSPNATLSSSGVLQTRQLSASPSPPSSFFQFQKVYQPQFVKTEEHNFFAGDDTCDFFSEEQAPTLHWYCSDQWS